ncbi:MAG: hypothetical protein ACK56F_04180, partial [bacterium]
MKRTAAHPWAQLRCSILFRAVAHPLRSSKSVQLLNFSSVAEELSSAGQPSGRRWISPLPHLWSPSDGASVRPQTLLQLFGYRCRQLPLIEKLPQWLSGPSSPLSVTAGPDSNDVRTRSTFIQL